MANYTQLAREAVFECGLTAGSLTDISAEGLGLDEQSLERTASIRVVTGGPSKSVRRKRQGRIDNAFSFTVDMNGTTEPIFLGRAGRTLHWKFYREGKGAGKPVITGQGIMVSNVTIPYDRDQLFSVNIAGDGAAARGTQ